MSERDTWTFEYEVAEVAEAATTQARYHDDRRVWWEREGGKAKKAIQDKGIEVREYEVTGGQRAQVVIDPALADRLGEAGQKIKWHRDKSEEYADWHAVLTVAADHVAPKLSLDHADIRYFGLHRNGTS